MGLWLTVNLEQYDNVEGYEGEAGIRVSDADADHYFA
jgi:hypothetical protein